MILLLITLLQSPPPILDGTISRGEWNDAKHFSGSGGLEVFLATGDSAVYLAVRGSGDGFPHVAVARGDSVFILHASAALGAARYVGAGDIKRLAQPFSFAMRRAEMDAAGQAERESFYSKERWVASTIRMGAAGETEFKIARSLIGPDGRIAIAYWSASGGVQRWPVRLTDAVAAQRMVQGFLEDQAEFLVTDWVPVK
jgi:hypothetical protein